MCAAGVNQFAMYCIVELFTLERLFMSAPRVYIDEKALIKLLLTSEGGVVIFA